MIIPLLTSMTFQALLLNRLPIEPLISSSTILIIWKTSSWLGLTFNEAEEIVNESWGTLSSYGITYLLEQVKAPKHRCSHCYPYRIDEMLLDTVVSRLRSIRLPSRARDINC